MVKADIGGAGAGITRYETPEALAEAAGEKWCPVGVNGISLIQEYAPRRDGKITRIETLGGKYLYAIDIESPGDAFDLWLSHDRRHLGQIRRVREHPSFPFA